MRRIALRTLFGVPGKAAGAVIGVAAAGTLILTQAGLYAGFLRTSSALITRTGGDVWVAARGTEVLDNGEPLPGASRMALASHPCVARVRGLVVDYAQVRKRSGALVTVQVVGLDRPGRGRGRGAVGAPMVPWSMDAGLPGDLAAPSRVAVEVLDLAQLGVSGEALGARLDVAGTTVTIAALTRGVRPFTLTPYLFTALPEARRLTALDPDAVTYWIADLVDPACAPAVVAHVGRERTLEAHTTKELVQMTRAFWVESSGVGAVLRFGALLALLVGSTVIGQTLSAITRAHLRELGTLAALGATGRELVGFVAWQATLLGGAGAVLALAVTALLRAALITMGLEVTLDAGVLAAGAIAIAVMCAIASASSVRAVLRLDPAEVLR